MANTILTDLTDGGVPAAGDLLYSVVGGQSRKVTVANLQTAMGTGVATEVIETITFSATAQPTSAQITNASDYIAIQAFISLTTDTDATANVGFQVSDDNGISWDATTDYYGRSRFWDSPGTALEDRNDSGNTTLFFTDTTAGWTLGNAAGESLSVVLTMHDPGGSSHKKFDWRGSYGDPANDAVHMTGGGHRRITSAIDKFRLNVSGGPVVTGTITLVGIRKTPVPATLPVFTGGQEIVEVQKITTSTAEVTFQTGIDGTGHMYEIIFNGVIPVNDSAQLRLTMSEDGGSTWLAGVDYFGASWFGSSGATTGQNNQAGAAFFSLCNAVDNLAGSGAAGTVKIFNAPDAQYTHIVANSTYKLGSNTWSYVELKNGHIDRSNAIDGFRLTFDTGNIAEGEFVLVKHLRQGQETPLPRGHFYRDPANPLFSANETDRDHDRGLVAPVHVRDSSDTVNMRLTTTMTKQIDFAWAQGDNAGGLFSGTVAASTTYYCHMIATAAGDVDWGWDTSPTAANKPAGWAYYRRLGVMRTDSSSNLEYPFAVVVDPPTTGWTMQAGTNVTGEANWIAGAEDGGLSVSLFANSVASDGIILLERTMPSTPYSVTARLRGNVAMWADAFASFGIGYRDSTGGRLEIFNTGDNLGDGTLAVSYWSSLEAATSNTIVATGASLMPDEVWMRFVDDGTNVTYFISNDGHTWLNFGNHSRTLNVTTPDRIFFGFRPNAGANEDMHVICDSWLED